jgi:protein-L-isoaspartate(D-aspartate) O-methyltransferase
MEMEPRRFFVAEIFLQESAKDCGIPIGHGVCASRPSTIAHMLSLLFEAGPRRRVLEIGTGCGWQTALLSKLAQEVYSIEFIHSLHERARRDLRGYPVQLKQGDGFAGWPEAAPFDGIIAACAAERIPETLLDQLAPGGVLVAPVGNANAQTMLRYTKDGSRYRCEECGPAGFTVASS